MRVNPPLAANLFDCRRVINRINPICGAGVVGAMITVHWFHFNSENSRSDALPGGGTTQGPTTRVWLPTSWAVLQAAVE